jgi:hypothetical protein
LQLLYGENIPLNDPHKELEEKEYNLLELSLAMDFLVTKLLFPRYLQANPIHVRKTLLFIYSFVHTIELLEKVIGRGISSNFKEEIKSLRNSWFLNKKEDNEESLKKAMISGFEATAQLVENLAIFLRTNFKLATSPKELILTLPDFYILGTEKWEKEYFWNEFSQGRLKIAILGKILKNYKILVPNSFFAIFSLYAREKGVYSDWFKKFLRCPDFSLDRSFGISKRLAVLNAIPLKKNKDVLFSLPFHYGFYTTAYFKERAKVAIFSLKRKFLKL